VSPTRRRPAAIEPETTVERRQEILDAAATLFSTVGIVPTTVRDIARSVGILSGSLYHHFDSKESMVDEIVSPRVRSLVDANRSVVGDSKSTQEALELLVRTVVREVTDHPKAWRILQNDSAYLQTLPRFGYLRTMDDEITRTWTRLLRKGATEGIIRSDVPAELLYRFVSDSISMLPRWYRPEGKYSEKYIEDAWVSLLSDAWARH
jgi:AcrR family transcriptional regulator